MTPFRRGKTWSIYVSGSAGFKQRTTGTTDARLARLMERMVKDLSDRREHDLLDAVIAGTLTVAELYDHYAARTLDALRARLAATRMDTMIERWTPDAMRVAPASWDQQVGQVKRLVSAIGDFPALTFVHELTTGAARDRLNALPVSDPTRRHYLYALSSFCSYCVAQGVLSSSPVEGKHSVKRPRKSKPRRVWKKEAVDRAIVDYCSGDVRIALVICAASGADRGSVPAMRVRDVALLPDGMATNAGKGIEHRVDIPGTKEDARDRRGVRLEPWAAPILRAWIKDKLPDALLVPGLSTDRMTRWWKVAAEATGHTGYWLRDTRHSYGCRAILAGYPLWEVSKWLGHADQYTTASIYTEFGYEFQSAIQAGSAGTTTVTTTADEPAKLSILKREA